MNTARHRGAPPRVAGSARRRVPSPPGLSRRGLFAVLAAAYVVGRLAVEIAINGRWVASPESIAHLLVVPVVQWLVLSWLFARWERTGS